MFTSIKSLAAGFGIVFGAGKIVSFAKDISRLGLQSEETSNAFENLSNSSGNLASILLGSLKQGFGGTVSDIQSMQLANNALLQGLPLTANNAQFLANAAERLGDAAGISAADAFEKLTFSVGTLQERGLKPLLGTIVDFDKAFKDFAASNNTSVDSLTNAQKQSIALNSVIDASKTKLVSLGQDTVTASDNVERLGAAWEDFKKQLSSTPTSAIGTISGFAANILESITLKPKGLDKNLDQIKEVNRAIGEGAEVTSLSQELQVVALERRVSLEQLLKSLLEERRTLHDQESSAIESSEAATYRQVQAQKTLNDQIRDSVLTFSQGALKIDFSTLQKDFNASGNNFQKLETQFESGVDFTKDEKISKLQAQLDKNLKIIKQTNLTEEQRINLIDLATRGYQDQKRALEDIKSTNGIKDKTQNIDDLIRKSQNPLSAGGISEAFKTQFLGPLPGQDLRRSSFIESGGVLSGESLSRSAREDRARSLGNSLNFDFKSLSPKQETQGSSPAQGQGENQKREESLNRLKQKTSDGFQKEIKLLNDISKQFENSIRNSDRLIGVVENQAGVLKEHESRITNLERIASSK